MGKKNADVVEGEFLNQTVEGGENSTGPAVVAKKATKAKNVNAKKTKLEPTLGDVMFLLESMGQRLEVLESNRVAKPSKQVKTGLDVHPPAVQVGEHGSILINRDPTGAQKRAHADMTVSERTEQIAANRAALAARDLEKHPRPARRGPRQDLMGVLAAMKDMSTEIAVTKLTDMKVRRLINDFKMVPVGYPAPEMVHPSTVIVTHTASGVVLEARLF